MTTCKQILEGKSIYLRVEGNDYSSQMWRSIDDVIEGVREWLQQKLKETALKLKAIKTKFPMIEVTDKTPLDLDLLLERQDVLLQLLEELK